MTATSPDLHEAARLVGEHRWLELQVFELAGRWVRDTTDPSAKLALDRHSGHSAWRAGQWDDRLPVLAGLDRRNLVQAPGAAWDSCLKQLSARPDTISRLAGLYRVVLPRLAQRYRSHLTRSSPVADGPTRRTLRMAITDVAHDRDEGDDVLEALLVDGPAVESAAAVVAAMEATLLR